VTWELIEKKQEYRVDFSTFSCGDQCVGTDSPDLTLFSNTSNLINNSMSDHKKTSQHLHPPLIIHLPTLCS
jgi:hypothetical protein